MGLYNHSKKHTLTNFACFFPVESLLWSIRIRNYKYASKIVALTISSTLVVVLSTVILTRSFRLLRPELIRVSFSHRFIHYSYMGIRSQAARRTAPSLTSGHTQTRLMQSVEQNNIGTNAAFTIQNRSEASLDALSIVRHRFAPPSTSTPLYKMMCRSQSSLPRHISQSLNHVYRQSRRPP